MGVAIQEEPQWRIDVGHVNLLDVVELPGLRSTKVRNHLVEGRRKQYAPDTAQLLGEAARSSLAMLNITLDERKPKDQRHWRWSSDDAVVPQQRRGSDCGLMTVLFAFFTARGWDMQRLSSLEPRDMRSWFLKFLNSQGQWKRAWSCTKCGHEVKRTATGDRNRQWLDEVTC